jgi:hypothetical protein
MSFPNEYFAELERQVEQSNRMYETALRDGTRAQLLLICMETRQVAPEADSIVFEPSDQGDFLDVTQVRDAGGRIIRAPAGDFDENGRAWDLFTDRPASQAVWEPLMETLDSRAGLRLLYIDNAMERLTNGPY